MTIEKFVRRSKIIDAHLAEIARCNRLAEFGGLMLPVNPYFRAVVIAQENLLNAVERLLESRPMEQAVESSRTPHETAPRSGAAPFESRNVPGRRLQRAS